MKPRLDKKGETSKVQLFRDRVMCGKEIDPTLQQNGRK
jgi:hypothetical protein